jgi:beta-lactamase regulating signal transducer with metallopeptidase domain
MTFDRANRSFLAIIVVSLLLGAMLLCGALGEILVPLALARMGRGQPLQFGLSLVPVVLFASLVVVGLVRTTRSLTSQAISSRRLSRRVEAAATVLPDRLRAAAADAGLASRVVMVPSSKPYSFAYGLLTPRVAVSSALWETFSDGELHAVLTHEQYHVRNLDPLKVVLVRAFSAGLFFLPAVALLRTSYDADRELAADRRAVAACGRRELAGALLRVVRGPDWRELDVVTSVGGGELLSVRVTQLENGSEPRAKIMGAREILLSFLGAAVLTMTFMGSISALGGLAAVQQVKAGGLAGAILISSPVCALLAALVAICGFGVVAARARRPL